MNRDIEKLILEMATFRGEDFAYSIDEDHAHEIAIKITVYLKTKIVEGKIEELKEFTSRDDYPIFKRSIERISDLTKQLEEIKNA